jgi:hypothetical protein
LRPLVEPLLVLTSERKHFLVPTLNRKFAHLGVAFRSGRAGCAYPSGKQRYGPVSPCRHPRPAVSWTIILPQFLQSTRFAFIWLPHSFSPDWGARQSI